MKFCDYGCGQEAKYYFPTVKKWCCSKSKNSCPVIRAKNSLRSKGKRKNKAIKISTDQKCFYGCNQRAFFLLSKSKKFCCSDHYKKCPAERDRCSERVNGIKNPMYGKKHTEEAKRKINPFGQKRSAETKQKMRLSAIQNIEMRIKNGGQIIPGYNRDACKLIDEYAKEHRYNFQHAENGGEFHIKELGYWVDGYDKVKNVVIEIDESFHFDSNGNLLEKDVHRQRKIEEHLKCKFIRLKI